jgi:hypothetical protein
MTFMSTGEGASRRHRFWKKRIQRLRTLLESRDAWWVTNVGERAWYNCITGEQCKSSMNGIWIWYVDVDVALMMDQACPLAVDKNNNNIVVCVYCLIWWSSYHLKHHPEPVCLALASCFVVFGEKEKSERYRPSEWRHSTVAPLISPVRSSTCHRSCACCSSRWSLPFLLAQSIPSFSIQRTMKLSLALATLAVGGASAFSVNNQYGALRTSTQLNAVRQPIMAGNWKVIRY